MSHSNLSDVERLNESLWRLGDETPRCPFCGADLKRHDRYGYGEREYCPRCGAQEIVMGWERVSDAQRLFYRTQLGLRLTT